jgi:hypothetical protein
MKNAVFWDVAPCRYFVNQRFGWTYRLHVQGIRNPRATNQREQVAQHYLNQQLAKSTSEWNYVEAGSSSLWKLNAGYVSSSLLIRATSRNAEPSFDPRPSYRYSSLRFSSTILHEDRVPIWRESWDRGLESHSRHGCTCAICVVLCAGSGLSTARFPVQRVLRIVYLLTHGAERFLRSCQLCSHSRISQRFMEAKGSLPPSQEPSTGPNPEPDRCNPHHSILSL